MGEEIWLVIKRLNDLFVFLAAAFAATIWVLKRMWSGTQQARTILAKLDNLAKEFKPNGGSSLRDVVIALTADMSEVKATVGSLQVDVRVNAARQWAYISGSPSPMFESDAHGMCVKVNPAMLRLTKRTVDEYLGHGWETIVYQKDRETVSQEWAAAVAQKRNYEGRFRVRSSDGRLFMVECHAMALTHNGYKNVLGYVGTYVSVEEITTHDG